MPRVLDSSALLAVVREEPGADVVTAALADPADRCYAHEINLCEAFYVAVRDREFEPVAAMGLCQVTFIR